MPGGSHSFAEVLQIRRESGLFEPPPRSNWLSNTRSADPSRLTRDTPAAVHASDSTPRIMTRDATRFGSTISNTSRRQSMRSAEQLISSHSQPEKRLSELSVITQVRAPSVRYSTASSSIDWTFYQSDSGRTTPRPHTAGGKEALKRASIASSFEAVQERPHTAMPGQHRQTTMAEQSVLRAADFDYHTALRRMEGQELAVKKGKRSNKLEKMLGSPVQTVHSFDHRRREPSLDLFEDDMLPEPSDDMDIPPIPPKSPKRTTTTAIAQTFLHRPSDSINRSIHNSSVASTSNQDSDLTNPDSDIFSDDEDDASSFTSGLSSLTDEFERRRKLDAKSNEFKSTTIAHASDGQHPVALSLNTESASVAAQARHNQQLPSPPDAVSCYDKLAMRSPTGVERMDFGASRVPDLAKATTSVLLAGSTMEMHVLDLSRRPTSPAFSDASDDSYDSACPPPVSLHRDHHGPKFRSREEQKRAYRPKPKPVSKDSPNASSVTLAKMRSHGSTSTNDLTVRPAQFASRNGSVVSASSDYAGNGTRQGAGFSLSKLFSRKKEKEPEPVLQPLRKITFDTRGQKQVVDLSASQISVSRYMQDPSTPLESAPMTFEDLRSRSYSGSTAGSVSSPTWTSSRSINNGQGSWRTRQPGTPRRTAWK